MEDDLRAQEEFLQSGKKPSVEIIKEKPRKSTSDESTPFLFASHLSPVGTIREREKGSVSSLEHPQTAGHGFPQAESVFRGNKSLSTRYGMQLGSERIDRMERSRSSSRRWRQKQSRNWRQNKQPKRRFPCHQTKRGGLNVHSPKR